MTARFETFARSLRPLSLRRAAITAAYRRPEPECAPQLLDLREGGGGGGGGGHDEGRRREDW